MNRLPEEEEGLPTVVVPELPPAVVVPELPPAEVGLGLAQSHSSVPVAQSAPRHLILVLLGFHLPSTQRRGVLCQERGRLLRGTWLGDLSHAGQV